MVFAQAGGVVASIVAYCQEEVIPAPSPRCCKTKKEGFPWASAQTGGQTLGGQSKKAIICQSCESGMIPLAGMPARVLLGQYNQRSERVLATRGRRATGRDRTAVCRCPSYFLRDVRCCQPNLSYSGSGIETYRVSSLSSRARGNKICRLW